MRLVALDHCVAVAGHLILLIHDRRIHERHIHERLFHRRVLHERSLSLCHVDLSTSSAAGSSSKNDVQAAPLPSGVSGW